MRRPEHNPDLAAPCRCDDPRVWDDDAPTCVACGRDVAVAADDNAEAVDGWIDLHAAIVRGAAALRQRAVAAGVDVDDLDAYTDWLELHWHDAPGLAAVPA